MSKQSGRGRVVGLPDWDRCAVMGVVNVTPDSFSDGGRWFDTTAAVKHGLALVAEGADLVDVGGESTRPGATRVDEAEELRRVVPVVRGLASEGAVVSVDTMRASVAAQALAAGAALVNDVSGGLADPEMIPVVADAGAPFVVMHWRGFLEGGNVKGVYDDVVREVVEELRERVDAVLAGGIAPDRVVVDPGLGFSKEAGHDLSLLARLDRLRGLGHPLLVAASRKRFLGRVLAGPEGAPPPARERDAATAAVSALAAQAGAWAVRVHEVRATADAVRVARAVEGARADSDAPDAVAVASDRTSPATYAPATQTPGAGRAEGAHGTPDAPAPQDTRPPHTSHTPHPPHGAEGAR
ncbi:dihydropteroate synthase [Streptomyces sp. NPDC048737]